MRYRVFSVLNLVVMMFYVLRPALPYIEYVINKSYIEKNLCVEKDNPENDCHGKCYLHEMIEEQSGTKDQDQNDRNVIPDKKFDDHLRSFSIIPVLYGQKVTMTICYSISEIIPFNAPIFVPPRG